MEGIIKIATFCIAVAMIILLLKSIKTEMSIGVLVAAAVVIFTYIALLISRIFEFGQDIIDSSGLKKEELGLVFKVIAASYVIEFARGICADSGEIGLAQKIEMCGRVYLVMLILPTCMSLIATITSFVG